MCVWVDTLLLTKWGLVSSETNISYSIMCSLALFFGSPNFWCFVFIRQILWYSQHIFRKKEEDVSCWCKKCEVLVLGLVHDASWFSCCFMMRFLLHQWSFLTLSMPGEFGVTTKYATYKQREFGVTLVGQFISPSIQARRDWGEILGGQFSTSMLLV